MEEQSPEHPLPLRMLPAIQHTSRMPPHFGILITFAFYVSVGKTNPDIGRFFKQV